jgi:hypothetical protein
MAKGLYDVSLVCGPDSVYKNRQTLASIYSPSPEKSQSISPQYVRSRLSLFTFAMKFFVAIAALLAGATARITERGDGHKCCFTLTSNGGVTDTAGQLNDGQVRVGGDYPPSHFCIDDDGCITDGTGRGCVLTSEYSG